jgi:hypothetical protein
MALNIEDVVEGRVYREEQLGCALGLEALPCPFPRLADAHVLRALPVAVSRAKQELKSWSAFMT